MALTAMLPNLPHSTIAFCRSLGVVLLSCLGLVGCASLGSPLQKADPEPDTQSGSSLGAELRKPGPPGQMLGIDDRAREIERNLGVR
jgi:hypothetical protein